MKKELKEAKNIKVLRFFSSGNIKLCPDVFKFTT